MNNLGNPEPRKRHELADRGGMAHPTVSVGDCAGAEESGGGKESRCQETVVATPCPLLRKENRMQHRKTRSGTQKASQAHLPPKKQKKLVSIGQMPYTVPMPQQVLQWRLKLKLTQQQVAKELGVNERTLRRYERGLHCPHALFATRLQEWVAEASAADLMVQESLPAYRVGTSRTPPSVSRSHQAHLQT